MTCTCDKARWTMDGDGYWACFRVDRGQAQAMTAKVEDGKTYTVEVKQERKRRSLDANSYFHVLVGKIAETQNLGFEEVKTSLVIEYGTVERDDEGAKVGFKLPESVDVTKIYRYVKHFDTREENGKRFNCYIVFKHTHLMDSREMARLIDGTIHEAKQLGIETLPPDKLAAMVSEWKGGG